MNFITIIDAVSKLVTIIGFPLLIFSIILLVRQLRIQSYHAIYEAVQLIDQYFVEHPYLRKYFYEAEKLPNDPKELEKILAVADMLMTFFEHVSGNKENFSKTKRERLIIYMKEVYRTPAMTLFMNKKKYWFSEELLVLLETD
ncbi:hypothetical protein GMMP13_100034 [Candidatus Magnetomoraceae bacterium gMMP-13]